MNSLDFTALDSWFRGYVTTHAAEDGSLHFVQEMKFQHSLHVAENAQAIASDLGWADDRVLTGRAAGLIHDTGRFSQFRQFGTLSDGRSVDHGLRGMEVLVREGVLDRLPADERQSLVDSALYHNRRFVPAQILCVSLPYVMLVRDADKLDILRVIHETLRSGKHLDHPEILLQVDPDGGLNPRLVRQILEFRNGSYEHVKSLADMHLMRIPWVYNFYFTPSLRIMEERGFLNGLGDVLPSTPEVQRILSQARRYVEDRLRRK